MAESISSSGSVDWYRNDPLFACSAATTVDDVPAVSVACGSANAATVPVSSPQSHFDRHPPPPIITSAPFLYPNYQTLTPQAPLFGAPGRVSPQTAQQVGFPIDQSPIQHETHGTHETQFADLTCPLSATCTSIYSPAATNLELGQLPAGSYSSFHANGQASAPPYATTNASFYDDAGPTFAHHGPDSHVIGFSFDDGNPTSLHSYPATAASSFDPTAEPAAGIVDRYINPQSILGDEPTPITPLPENFDRFRQQWQTQQSQQQHQYISDGLPDARSNGNAAFFTDDQTPTLDDGFNAPGGMPLVNEAECNQTLCDSVDPHNTVYRLQDGSHSAAQIHGNSYLLENGEMSRGFENAPSLDKLDESMRTSAITYNFENPTPADWNQQQTHMQPGTHAHYPSIQPQGNGAYNVSAACQQGLNVEHGTATSNPADSHQWQSGAQNDQASKSHQREGGNDPRKVVPPPPDSGMIFKQKDRLKERMFYTCSCHCAFQGTIDQVRIHQEQEHGEGCSPPRRHYRCWWSGCTKTYLSVADMDRHEDTPHDQQVTDGRVCSFPGCDFHCQTSGESDTHYNECHRDRKRNWWHCLEQCKDRRDCDRHGVDAFRRLDHLHDHQERVHKVGHSKKRKRNEKGETSSSSKRRK